MTAPKVLPCEKESIAPIRQNPDANMLNFSDVYFILSGTFWSINRIR